MPAKRNPARAVAAMADQEPEDLEALNAIIRRSEPLVPGATQAVLGEGPVRRVHRLRRRAAGRPGGSAGPPLRRAGRAAAGPRHGGGRDRPRAGLPHECGQAFQVRAARQAPHPPEADGRRGQPLPLVAERELEFVAPQARGGARRHRGAGAHRQGDPDHPRARARPSSTSPMRASSPCTRPTCCACPTRRRTRPMRAFVQDLRRIRTLSEELAA